jgi:hypothetical protein
VIASGIFVIIDDICVINSSFEWCFSGILMVSDDKSVIVDGCE